MDLKINNVEPVKRVNLTSQVMESVKTYMSANNLVAGDRLPTERELTAQLQVSRNILREALKSLEALGLIEIKPGDGIYVTDFDYSSVVSHISFAISRTESDLDEFTAARLVIELGAMDMARNRVTDEIIDMLEDSIIKLENAASIEDAAEEDLNFHNIILGVAENRILSEFGSFLGRFFAEAQYLVGIESKPSTAQGHRALVTALKKRDMDRAKDIMKDHILSWKDVRLKLNEQL